MGLSSRFSHHIDPTLCCVSALPLHRFVPPQGFSTNTGAAEMLQSHGSCGELNLKLKPGDILGLSITHRYFTLSHEQSKLLPAAFHTRPLHPSLTPLGHLMSTVVFLPSSPKPDLSDSAWSETKSHSLAVQGHGTSHCLANGCHQLYPDLMGFLASPGERRFCSTPAESAFHCRIK